MKKIVLLLCLLLAGTGAFAVQIEVVSSTQLTKQVKEAHEIGYKIIRANNLKRAPIFVNPSNKVVNASAHLISKEVTIYTGILPYLDNDDEYAYVISHELAHAMEAYGGALKVWAMNFNSKKYEYKADLNGIDYMVKAGYNPIAAIIAADKINPEPRMDWLSTHPQGSKRMLEMYKYIYIKYPQYLSSSMTGSIIYQNFLSSQSKELQKFKNQQRQRRHEAI